MGQKCTRERKSQKSSLARQMRHSHIGAVTAIFHTQGVSLPEPWSRREQDERCVQFGMLMACSATMICGAILTGTTIYSTASRQGIIMDYTGQLLPRAAVWPTLASGILMLFAVLSAGCKGAAYEIPYPYIVAFGIFVCGVIIMMCSSASVLIGAQDKFEFERYNKTIYHVKLSPFVKLFKDELVNLMKRYKNDTVLQMSWDTTQYFLECCGIMGPDDWFKLNKIPPPLSCCYYKSNSFKRKGPTEPNFCERQHKARRDCKCCSNEIFVRGCLDALAKDFSNEASVIGGLSMGFMSLLVMVVIASIISYKFWVDREIINQ